jgi:hypothetical protein
MELINKTFVADKKEWKELRILSIKKGIDTSRIIRFLIRKHLKEKNKI